jgi:outer membrane usher protein
MDASLQRDSMNFTPAWRTGAVVRFPIQHANAATLRLVQADGKPVPAGAEVRIGDRSFPVAIDGKLYLTGLSENGQVEASWRDRSCRAELARPVSAEPIPDLGTITCMADNLAP